VVIILVGMALLNTVRFAGFASERKYSIVEGARSLDRILSDGVFLVGDCATTMSLEADFRTLPAYGDLIRYDEREQFERYPITHFILRFPTLYEYLQKHYPGFSESIAAVRTFPLCGRDATIVRYEAWPGFAKSGYKPSDFEVAMGLLQAGQFEQASGVFEAFLAARSDSYEALVGLAICRMRSGRSDDAVALMEQALEITDRDALSYEIYGDLLSNLGRDTEARAQWHEALKLNPNSRNLRSKLGMRRR
jgi:tetratricopeptide (TPR) repeat protein